MASIQQLGPLLADGGCIFVYLGAPNLSIVWSASAGLITALVNATDGAGLACAYYNPAGGVPAPAGTAVNITAGVYA